MAGLVTPYKVVADFGGSYPDVDILRREIVANVTITQTPNFITVVDDDAAGTDATVDVDFTTPLSAPEITALDNIVAAHPSITTLNSDGRKVYESTAMPTANDDADDGVNIGDLWVNTATNKAYINADNTVGAAVWTLLAPESGAVTVDTVDPTVSDDNTQGFSIGDLWVNTTTDEAWIVTDVSTGAAVWEYITPSVIGGLIVEGDEVPVFSHNSTSYQEMLSITTGSIPAGEYMLHWSYRWNCSRTNRSIDVKIEQDDTTEIMRHIQEPKDVQGDYAGTGSNQRHQASGYKKLTLGSGTYQFDLDFQSQASNTTVSLWEAHMYLQRIS